MAMRDLPAHASPALPPLASPQPQHPNGPPHLALSRSSPRDQFLNGKSFPGTFISPAATPPSTPNQRPLPVAQNARSYAVDTSQQPAPGLLAELPKVECVVRTRIPTKFGQMWLHLYQNSIDNKEHLAIVFGDAIRSKSLFAAREGETEQDRIIRGAYEGKLYPGRTHSALESMDGSTGKMSPLLKSIHKPAGANILNGSVSTSEQSSRASSSNQSSTPSSPLSSSAPDSIDPNESLTPSAPLVRIHSECYTGETVWSARCDCGEQLDEAARLMSEPSASRSGGVIVYLRQEGRGIGLSEKLKAYNLQDLGNDTVEANVLLRHPADARSYGLATAMLIDLGLGRRRPQLEGASQDAGNVNTGILENAGPGIRLLTNNPDKIRAVEGPNREVVVRERVKMVPSAMGEEKAHYMRTKIEKMGHLLSMG